MFNRDQRLIEELWDVGFFAACTPDQLQVVARVSDEVRFPAGATLMQEDEPGRDCYVVLEGRADVEIGGEKIATLRAGEIVGEMAIIEDAPRTATVTASTPLRALQISPKAFAKIVDVSPAIARRVLRTLAQRLRNVQAA
jgi:CRP/FNR family transcriptional regulator, cyclic AMP receptor protein